jgi:hypothetical protein
MQVKINDTNKVCSAPIEQMLFKGSEKIGWLLSFTILDDMTTDDIQNLLPSDGIVTFVKDDGTEFSVSGYETINSAVIRHYDREPNTEIQLSKRNSEVTSNA